MSGIALAEGDLAAIGRQAHSLVAAAGNIGAMRASAIARELEQACRTNNSERATQLVVTLIATANATSAAVLEWLSDEVAPDEGTFAQSA
jgi:HPt (histidine-containing phosphotransfer) domain-containing protein